METQTVKENPDDWRGERKGGGGQESGVLWIDLLVQDSRNLEFWNPEEEDVRPGGGQLKVTSGPKDRNALSVSSKSKGGDDQDQSVIVIIVSRQDAGVNSTGRH